MVNARVHTSQGSAHQVNLNVVKGSGASSGAEVQPPSAGHCGALGHASGVKEQGRQVLGSWDGIAIDSRQRQGRHCGNSGGSQCARKPLPVQRRINLEWQGLVVPLHAVGTALDALKRMVGRAVVAPACLGFLVSELFHRRQLRLIHCNAPSIAPGSWEATSQRGALFETRRPVRTIY